MDRSAVQRGWWPVFCIIVAGGAQAQERSDAPPIDFGLLPSPMVSANGAAVITIADAPDQTLSKTTDPDSTDVDAVTDDHADIVIDEPAAATNSSPADAEPAETEAGIAALQTSSIAAPAPPASESKSLGRPNSIFSARPAESESKSETDDSETEAHDDGALGPVMASIDPRTSPMARVLLSLGFVLLLLFGLKSLMKRGAGFFGQVGRPSGVIEILARYPLDRKQSLVLIKLARRVLLLHQSGAQMTTLSEIADPIEVASLLSRVESGSSGKQAMRFRGMLKRFEAEHESAHRQNNREDLFPALDDGSGAKIVDLTRRQRRLPAAASGRRGG